MACGSKDTAYGCIVKYPWFKDIQSTGSAALNSEVIFSVTWTPPSFADKALFGLEG